MVWSSNYSTGVNTLFWLTRKAAEILGAGFDLEIIEMHHRLKKDAPSGTASTLAEILARCASSSSKSGAPRPRRHRWRTHRGGNRHPFRARRRRGGRSHGDFCHVGERLELTHKASSRETFANGALRAALWVVKQKPGLYDMQDVLGLK